MPQLMQSAAAGGVPLGAVVGVSLLVANSDNLCSNSVLCQIVGLVGAAAGAIANAGAETVVVGIGLPMLSEAMAATISAPTPDDGFIGFLERQALLAQQFLVQQQVLWLGG
jgi:hypothetical protein